ncbi:hypothetical protein HOG21_05110 [bacterium]|nr:hypothetical protein [bacterium]
MKKIFIIFFIFISFFSSYVYANNTEENIKKAVLVENYITNQKEKIEEYIIKYSIYNKTINYNISELDNLIKILKSIQNKNIEKDKAEKMLIKILKKIKSVNNELKILLKKEKDLYNKEFIKKLNLYSEL